MIEYILCLTLTLSSDDCLRLAPFHWRPSSILNASLSSIGFSSSTQKTIFSHLKPWMNGCCNGNGKTEWRLTKSISYLKWSCLPDERSKILFALEVMLIDSHVWLFNQLKLEDMIENIQRVYQIDHATRYQFVFPLLNKMRRWNFLQLNKQTSSWPYRTKKLEIHSLLVQTKRKDWLGEKGPYQIEFQIKYKNRFE